MIDKLLCYMYVVDQGKLLIVLILNTYLGPTLQMPYSDHGVLFYGSCQDKFKT